MFEDIYKIKSLKSRSVTQENIKGEKGRGGMEENGKKGRPALKSVKQGETVTLCDIEGRGLIRHIWLTFEAQNMPEMRRNLILRMYWDDSLEPSVFAPVGDFFGVPHGHSAHYMSLLLGTPQGRGYQCYFQMPFRRKARITATNESTEVLDWLFYQIDYTLGDEFTDDMCYFYSYFRRENPTRLGVDYTILDVGDVAGIYLGASIGVNPYAKGWWGEGEVKIYLDGDGQFPTICGTGVEDYACVGFGFGEPHDALYSGLVCTADENYSKHVGFYRFHLLDPVYFHSDIRVTMQQMGATLDKETIEHPDIYPYNGPFVHKNGMSDWLYERVDDVCSCAYWYQDKLGMRLPNIPGYRERTDGILSD